MKLEIVTIPCLADNYAFLIHNHETNQTAVVDVPNAQPIKDELTHRNWQLDTILITHHHSDHIDGVEELRQTYRALVVGHKLDKHRLPKLDLEVLAESDFEICGTSAQVLGADGHTVGHVAYIVQKAAFTGDSLMALGCGRLFEGTPEMMWQTLSQLATLPPETIIYSGHEYTASNAKFALTIEPNNSDLKSRYEDIKRHRRDGIPTVPSELSLELKTNPFLRANLPSVKRFLGLESATDNESFAEIRARKDRF